MYDQETQINIKQLLKIAENLKNVCGMDSTPRENEAKKPQIKKVSLNRKKSRKKVKKELSNSFNSSSQRSDSLRNNKNFKR